MSGIHRYTPRQAYRERTRKIPLSETISEMETLFEGGLELFFKSAEERVEIGNNFAKGTSIGYKDEAENELFVYFGLVYKDNHCGMIYPNGLYIGTDLERGKLEKFLIKLQKGLPYEEKSNIFDTSEEIKEGRALLLTCAGSTKMRTKGLYDDLNSLSFASTLNDLKQILDKGK